jgi:hypothetical protein
MDTTQWNRIMQRPQSVLWKRLNAGFRVVDAEYDGIAIVARHAGEVVQPEVVKILMKSQDNGRTQVTQADPAARDRKNLYKYHSSFCTPSLNPIIKIWSEATSIHARTISVS